MSFWVYALRSNKDGRCYVGSGADVDQRLRRHNRGDYRYTKGHRPWVVIYREKFDSRPEAVRRERFLKTGVGRKQLKEKLFAQQDIAPLCNGSTPPFGGESLGSSPSGAE